MAHLDFEKPLAELETRVRELRGLAERDEGIETQIARLERRLQVLLRETYGNLTPWQKVLLSRHPDRPYFLDYAGRLFEDFVELHGDRQFHDDPAIVAGFARFQGRAVAVIGQQKGRTAREKAQRNFGMPHPEGYRKACRVMELAERFGRPVLTFIDTPGAHPGLGAEERGQGEAIGRSILAMVDLRVPSVAVVIGEGGSGGALALGVANRVLMLEYSTYSVITPEGCASILWRDAAFVEDAARQLRLSAADVSALGVVDAVIGEPAGGAHRDLDATARRIEHALGLALASLDGIGPDTLRSARAAKYRAMGAFLDAPAENLGSVRG